MRFFGRLRFRPVSPVFFKEMVTMARGRRYYFVRALLIGVLLFFISTSWNAGRNGPLGMIDTSWVGAQLFEMFSIVQLFAVLILVPALTAPVVAVEKQRETLGLLMMTNLSAANLILDKFLSRFVMLICLLLSGVPIFLCLLAFGGVTPEQIGVAYAYILATALFCSGIGLFWSTVASRHHTALITTYVSMIAYTFFWIFVTEVVDAIDDEIIPYVLPLVGWDSSSSEVSAVVVFCAISCLVFLASLMICLRILPGMASQTGRPWIKRVFARVNDFFHMINFTGVVVWQEKRKIGNDPLYWKEVRGHFFASRMFLVRATYVLFIVSTVLLVAGGFDVESTGLLVLGLSHISMMLIALVSSAVSFSGERERHSFDVLMSTPVEAARVVRAKIAGVLRLLMPLFFLCGIWLVVSVLFSDLWNYYYHDRRFATLTNAMVTAVAIIPMLIIVGMWSSVQRKRTGMALLQSFLVVLAWSCAPLFLVMLDQGSLVDVTSDTIEAFASASPAGAVIMMFDNDFSPISALLLVPIWTFFLAVFVVRFDRMAGRA